MKKRQGYILLFPRMIAIPIMISVSLLIPLLVLRPACADEVRVTAPVARIQKDPSADSSEIGIAHKGDTLEIIKAEGNWFKVRLPNNGEGWVSGALVQESGRERFEDIDFSEEEDIGADEDEKQVIFHLKVIKPSVNMRQKPDATSNVIGTVKGNDILVVLSDENGWYRCKAPNGTEGWIMSNACILIPIHSDSADTELRSVIVNREKVPVKAGPLEAYPLLGELSIDQEVGVYLEEGEWLYVKGSDEGLEGWIRKEDVYDPQKHMHRAALKEEILKIADKLCNYYDQKKKELKSYQNAGWYPSFTIFLREKDINIQPYPSGLKLELTFSLRRISIDNLFPLPLETMPVALSQSDRLFFMTLLQTLMENEPFQEIEVRLKGLKKEGGSLKWINALCFTLKKATIDGMDLDKVDPNTFWNVLIQCKN